MLFPLLVALSLFIAWESRHLSDLKFIEGMIVLLMYRFDLFVWKKVQPEGEKSKSQ